MKKFYTSRYGEQNCLTDLVYAVFGELADMNRLARHDPKLLTETFGMPDGTEWDVYENIGMGIMSDVKEYISEESFNRIEMFASAYSTPKERIVCQASYFCDYVWPDSAIGETIKKKVGL